MQQQILRLEITMHDIMPTQNAKSLHHLRKIHQRCLLRKASLLLEQFLKCSSIAVLIDKVVVIGSFEHIEIFDDVWTRLECAEDVDLVVGALLELRVLLEFLGFDHLYGDLLLCLDVYAFEDGGVHPAAYLVLQVVVLDRFSHLFNYYKMRLGQTTKTSSAMHSGGRSRSIKSLKNFDFLKEKRYKTK